MNSNILFCEGRELINSSWLAELLRLDKQLAEQVWSKENWFSFLNSKRDFKLILGIRKKALFGFCLFEMNSNGFAELHKIVVDQPERNKSYGQSLLSEFKRYLSKNCVERGFLQVKESNITAQNFYKKNEFLQQRVLSNYYGKEAALEMCWSAS